MIFYNNKIFFDEKINKQKKILFFKMLTEYLIKLLLKDNQNLRKNRVSPRIFNLNDDELSERLLNSFNPKIHLEDLKELHKEYLYRMKKLKYESKNFKNLEVLIDSNYLKHDKHGAILLNLIGAYNFKFKPKINMELSLNYLLNNYPNLKDVEFNNFYHKVSKDNFNEIENFVRNLYFSKNKKMFAVFYGYLSFI